ncbi:MAG: molybdenum cofactor guanylyltransferase [Candidatus Methanomethylicia archaeon]
MDACLIILAGGAGERIGIYKPLLKICGKTIMEMVLENLAEEFNETLIVVHDEKQREILEMEINPLTRKFGIRYVFDTPIIDGPLAAIYAGALSSKYEKIAISPSDTPFINPKIFVKMENYLDGGCEAVVPRWPNGFLEPLISMYLRRPLIKALAMIINLGERRVQSIFRVLKTRYVDVYDVSSNPEREFFNINTMEDLKKLGS